MVAEAPESGQSLGPLAAASRTVGRPRHVAATLPSATLPPRDFPAGSPALLYKVITDASADGLGSTRIETVTHLLLDSYDLEPPFAQRSLTVLSTARCGERADWFWMRVEPALEVGPNRSLRTTLLIDVVAIAARHTGTSLEGGPWPVHVYVCRAKADETRLAAEFSPEDISIEYWGTVKPAEAHTASNRRQSPER
jgi:hypothetical protein